jgi:hypothetical protein
MTNTGAVAPLRSAADVSRGPACRGVGRTTDAGAASRSVGGEGGAP